MRESNHGITQGKPSPTSSTAHRNACLCWLFLHWLWGKPIDLPMLSETQGRLLWRSVVSQVAALLRTGINCLTSLLSWMPKENWKKERRSKQYCTNKHTAFKMMGTTCSVCVLIAFPHPQLECVWQSLFTSTLYLSYNHGQTILLQQSQSLLDDCLPFYVLVSVPHLSTLTRFCTTHFSSSFAKQIHISKNTIQKLFILRNVG